MKMPGIIGSPEEAVKLVSEIYKSLPEEKREKLKDYVMDAFTDLLAATHGESSLDEALGISSKIVNKVGKGEGVGKILKIKAEEAEISFHVPESVMEMATKNPELTREQRIAALQSNKWAIGWARGLMSKMMPERWAKMSEEEKTEAISRAIKDVLAPSILV